MSQITTIIEARIKLNLNILWRYIIHLIYLLDLNTTAIIGGCLRYSLSWFSKSRSSFGQDALVLEMRNLSPLFLAYKSQYFYNRNDKDWALNANRLLVVLKFNGKPRFIMP